MSESEGSERNIADEIEVIRVVDDVDNVDNAVDSKDWQKRRSYSLDEIHADMTSLASGSPGSMRADDPVGGRRTNLFSEKLTHHMRTNHRVTVDGDEAEVVSKGYALNILPSELGSDLWEVWGDYVHALRRVEGERRVSGMSLFVKHALKHSRGNERARDFVPHDDS